MADVHQWEAAIKTCLSHAFKYVRSAESVSHKYTNSCNEGRKNKTKIKIVAVDKRELVGSSLLKGLPSEMEGGL